MWKAEIKNGTLYLEGKKVPCLKSYHIDCDGEGSTALTLEIDVAIDETESDRMQWSIWALRSDSVTILS